MKKIDQALRLEEIEELLKSSYRTTTILELFIGFNEGLQIGEITKLMKIPQSSASTLVKSLSESGFLLRDPHSRKYFLTPRLGFLGHSASAQHQNLDQLSKQADKISLRVGETTVIAMQNGIYSQYIYISRNHTQGHHDHVALGSLRPMVCSATGWAMLLSESDAKIGKLVRSTNATVTDSHWIDTAKSAVISIQTSRDKGYAFSQGPSESGTAGIAIPLSTLSKFGNYSIGIAGREDDLKKKEDLIIRTLKEVPL